jgi:membrane associated rhomboid family serine protease
LKTIAFAAKLNRMFSACDYRREISERLRCPATLAILAANGLVFVAQMTARHFFSAYWFDEHFALSLDGLKSGEFWQVLTFQFVHANWAHLFLNAWAIFMFGPIIEQAWGRMRMLSLYFCSGAAGGLLQIAGGLFATEQFGGAVIGASAGAFGLVAAFVVLYPKEIFLILPLFIKIRARTFLWLSIAFALVGTFLPFGSIAHLAHLAHLGGIGAGWIIARSIKRRADRGFVPAAELC